MGRRRLVKLDDRELELIVSDGAYPLKEYKAKALAAELLRLRKAMRAAILDVAVRLSVKYADALRAELAKWR